MHAEFLNALASSRRSSEIPEHDVYGWLVGSWELNVDYYAAVDLREAGIKGEVHFSWVLEGRAVQDTWIMPVSSHREEQIGRRIGPDIVQIGARQNGTPTRWRFTEITPDSFLWIGDALQPDGKTWKLEGQFRARRITTHSAGS